jgi:molybdenum cofactor synthesis domain-containing protein
MTSTAAILIIGNEILSGKTQDTNTPWLAQRLGERGIRLCEVRVVRDEEEAIVRAVHALKDAYTYVFTTGGIGPTHDDITADCMARAFGVEIGVREDARALLAAYYSATGKELNDARLRMARIPSGAALIDNPVSGAPGFKLENVYVMAGVPKIMQGMFGAFADTLKGGPPVLSRAVTGAIRESDIAEELAAIQNAFPDIEIGSYPKMKEGRPEVSLVLRGQDEKRLSAALVQTAALARKWDKDAFIS